MNRYVIRNNDNKYFRYSSKDCLNNSYCHYGELEEAKLFTKKGSATRTMRNMEEDYEVVEVEIKYNIKG